MGSVLSFLVVCLGIYGGLRGACLQATHFMMGDQLVGKDWLRDLQIRFILTFTVSLGRRGLYPMGQWSTAQHCTVLVRKAQSLRRCLGTGAVGASQVPMLELDKRCGKIWFHEVQPGLKAPGGIARPSAVALVKPQTPSRVLWHVQLQCEGARESRCAMWEHSHAPASQGAGESRACLNSHWASCPCAWHPRNHGAV